MRQTTDRIRALTGGWSPPQFERTYAPGKWTARQILTHLAETEIALGYRIRMALATPGYVAQPMDQDAWIAKEPGTSGSDAAAARFGLLEVAREHGRTHQVGRRHRVGDRAGEPAAQESSRVQRVEQVEDFANRVDARRAHQPESLRHAQTEGRQRRAAAAIDGRARAE